MRRFGLIGYPLTHSFSKKYFEEKFHREKITGCAYELFPLTSIEGFPNLIKSDPELIGLNVTIPYKEPVIQYLDELDDKARQIGAVNCLKGINGKWKGYNTDVIGFEKSLFGFLNELPQQAFVLGTGGSSKAVCYALERMKIPFTKVSRQPLDGSILYNEIENSLTTSNLFVNTTPLGMFPKTEECPDIPYDKLGANDFLFDLVYNPAETIFLKKGREKGANTKNGLEMLQLQAEESWKIWNSGMSSKV